MAIDNIRSDTCRRVLLIIALPLLPFQAIANGAIAVLEDVMDWPSLVRAIWRQRI